MLIARAAVTDFWLGSVTFSIWSRYMLMTRCRRRELDRSYQR